jgi:molybdopterin/thiamine biosynthesis adenylyltransferase
VTIPDFLTGRQNDRNYTPKFYRLSIDKDLFELEELLKNKPYIQISDTVGSQVKELVRSINPSRKFTPAEHDEATRLHLNNTPLWQYGVWVYYSWSERLVHTLDEKEFTILRTNRNKHKITDEERETLSQKKIGVIGLSVGQSVSVTLAMERSFGELRIADFDELEITNLNRLRSGIHNMGIAKTILVAREIAEIDPFLKVVPYHDGITEDNLESFLLEGGKLDVLIDECDSVDIKIQCRVAAKKHSIPVLMEASDRATIDVERFDLEKDRPILHGFIAHLDISKLKDLKTSEEKLPYMLPIAGVETLSTRMKASALEIGQTINTWPQLASAVTMGGGITADVCRRMLLDQYHESGRYFVDIEELIGDKNKPRAYTEEPMPELTVAAMTAIVDGLAPDEEHNNIELPTDSFDKIMEAALSAPSPGNNQPWKWLKDGNRLWLFHDHGRSYSFGDFEHMASYMALGAALQNITLAAEECHLNAGIDLFPAGGSEVNPVALVRFSNAKSERKLNDLTAYINTRYTNRKKGNSSEVDPEILRSIEDSVTAISGAELHFATGTEHISRMAEIISQSERLRVFIPQGHYDLFEKELRWTPQSAKETADGLDISTFDFTETGKFGMRMARDPKVASLLREWNGGHGIARMSRESVESFSAVGLLTMPSFNAISCINAGKAIELAWLTATRYNVAFQPMLAPLLHFARLRYGGAGTMPADIETAFREYEKKFDAVWNINSDKTVPMFLFRMGYADIPEVKSYRLPMSKILFTKG